ncbi:MAG: mechanosensitive ion channel family protein [Bacteroidales bacterium]|nr:mechanosensitive ion channel family protein [Bacteroidales bacterium]
MLQHSFIDFNELWSNSEARLAILITSAIVLFYICDIICRRLILPAVNKVTSKTTSKWDDILFNRDVLTNVSRLIPPIVLKVILPYLFSESHTVFFWADKVIDIYIVATATRLACAIFNSLYDISNENQRMKNRTLKGVFQMFKIIALCIGAIIIVSIVIDKNPANILTGLGAMAAVLMLVFKDPIMGLVAGVQLSANDMLRQGDWITLPKHNADGEVVEVTLTTVKVKNWDKTITTIPPYVLVSESFQNWRGMFDSGGRRIKRSLYIDMNTIGFCSKEQVEKFREKGWLKGIECTDGQVVNLTVLRNYLDIYLRNNERVNHEMIFMIRQLQPTPQGLPLELYFFSADTAWVAYEHLQADVFEHILAVMPEFGLKVFQAPAGTDLSGLIGTRS